MVCEKHRVTSFATMCLFLLCLPATAVCAADGSNGCSDGAPPPCVVNLLTDADKNNGETWPMSAQRDVSTTICPPSAMGMGHSTDKSGEEDKIPVCMIRFPTAPHVP